MGLDKYNENLKKLHSFSVKMLPILLIMFVIDVIYSGGVPLIWIIFDTGQTHADFGIPTFHGTFHGILLFFVTSSFFLLRQGFNKKENLFHIILFFIYAAIVFNRGIVCIFIIQLFFINLIIMKKISIKHFFLFLILSVFLIFIFGVLGDFRTGYNVFYTNIKSEWEYIFEFLPKSFLWFYAYYTGGLNNLYANIPNIEPTYFPFYTFARMVPTLVYKWIGITNTNGPFTLASASITISTAFQGILSDFGLFGILLYLPVIIFAQISYRKALKGNIFSILIYGILMQTIIMTPYIDTIFYLTFLLQIFLAIYALQLVKFKQIRDLPIIKIVREFKDKVRQSLKNFVKWYRDYYSK